MTPAEYGALVAAYYVAPPRPPKPAAAAKTVKKQVKPQSVEAQQDMMRKFVRSMGGDVIG